MSESFIDKFKRGASENKAHANKAYEKAKEGARLSKLGAMDFKNAMDRKKNEVNMFDMSATNTYGGRRKSRRRKSRRRKSRRRKSRRRKSRRRKTRKRQKGGGCGCDMSGGRRRKKRGGHHALLVLGALGAASMLKSKRKSKKKSKKKSRRTRRSKQRGGCGCGMSGGKRRKSKSRSGGNRKAK